MQTEKGILLHWGKLYVFFAHLRWLYPWLKTTLLALRGLEMEISYGYGLVTP